VAAADEAWQLLLLTDGAVVTAAVAAALTAIVAACWQTIGGHAAEGHVDVTNDTVEATCNVLECSEFPAVTVARARARWEQRLAGPAQQTQQVSPW